MGLCSHRNVLIISLQCLHLESYQKRVLRIIYGDQIKGMPYQNALFLANLKSLIKR